MSIAPATNHRPSSNSHETHQPLSLLEQAQGIRRELVDTAARYLRMLKKGEGNPDNLISRLRGSLAALQGRPDPIAVAECLSITSRRNTYMDPRPGFNPHNAFDFSVTLPHQLKLGELLDALLGTERKAFLLSDWSKANRAIDVNQSLPRKTEVALFVHSNDKPRYRAVAPIGARTTQEEDFAATGLRFAKPYEAIVIFSTAIKMAELAGLNVAENSMSWAQGPAGQRLKEPLHFLLTRLKSGVIRTELAIFRIDNNGCLRSEFVDRCDGAAWALGSRPSKRSR